MKKEFRVKVLKHTAPGEMMNWYSFFKGDVFTVRRTKKGDHWYVVARGPFKGKPILMRDCLTLDKRVPARYVVNRDELFPLLKIPSRIKVDQSLEPGDMGAKEETEKWGPALYRIRYRKDKQGNRWKTIELAIKCSPPRRKKRVK